MIRNLNFTGRKRIPRGAARITLHREADGGVRFEAELDLGGYDLPPTARVFIEAAFKTSFMRFDWGVIAQLVPCENRSLSRLVQPALAHFRVKVIEPSETGLGRLLAVADNIAPQGVQSGEKKRIALFRVNVGKGELTDEVWRLDFDSAGPILDLSSQISGIKELARQEAFMALVFPSVVRQVLEKIFDEGNDDPEFDRDSWQSRWLRFGAQLSEAPPPPLLSDDREPDETHREWIETAVAKWSRRQKIVANYKKRFGGTEGAVL